MIRDVICGVWALSPTSCCVATRHSMDNVAVIVDGRMVEAVTLAR